MTRWLRLGIAGLAVLVAGCQAVSDGYRKIFGNPAPKPAELVSIPQPRAALRIAWQGSVGPADRNIYFPARSGTVVWAAGAAGSAAAFDMARGTPTGRIEAGERVTGAVGAGSGLVLLGTPKGEVLAFDPAGKLLWKTQLSSAVLAPPQAEEGIVVARAGDGHLYGLDAATGKQRWVYQRAPPALSVRTHAGVVIDRGGVFVGFPAGRLVALSLTSGNVGWEAVVALPRGATELERVADITSLPVMDGGRICAAAFQGRVACLDAARGTMLWARDVSSVAGIGVDDRYLYVTDDKDAVMALDKTSGASIWRQDRMARRSVSAPLPIGRYVAVGDIEGYVHLLSRDDGSFAARIATDGSAISAPPIALDVSTFLVQTRNGGVFAITIQ
jgi:outer membrane protein assembly factor BamB